MTKKYLRRMRKTRIALNHWEDENQHVGEAATISEPLDERLVEFSKNHVRSVVKE